MLKQSSVNLKMANPRRSSYNNNESSDRENNNPLFHVNQSSGLMSLKRFLKKPHAIPFLLSILLFLAWLSLRFQQPNTTSNLFPSSSSRKWTSTDDDADANLVRFKSGNFPSPIAKDQRGWLLDPVSLSLRSGLKGGALSCSSVHLGEIRPGSVRGNHRHYACNETFVIWGAKTLFRLESKEVSKGYGQVIINEDEVAIAASPSGTAHVLVNVDPVRTSFFIGCQDSVISYNASSNDFNVWKDI